MAVTVPAEVLARGSVRVDGMDHLPGRVISVILDRPEARNAQTPATWAALDAIGGALDTADATMAVIRGEGSAFSAGLDRRMFTPDGIPGETSLAAMATMSDEQMAAQIEEYQRAFTWQRRVPALTVAAVHGPAIGAGFQLALACDVILASPSASFAMRETSWGLVPDLGGTGPLVRAVGYSRAVDICATGRMISAEEGFALGFVTRVVPDLDECIADMAMSIASAPPGAVRDLMPLLALGEINDRQEQLSAERRTQVARLRDLLGGN